MAERSTSSLLPARGVDGGRPHVAVVVQRGGAFLNICSGMLPELAKHARVTLLTVSMNEAWRPSIEPFVERIIELEPFKEKWIVVKLRKLVHALHWRYFWNELARNHWERMDHLARSPLAKVRRILSKAAVRVLARRPLIEMLFTVERFLAWRLRPTNEYDRLFEELRPDLIYDGTQVHKRLGYFLIEVARRLGIPTVGFIHSWDQLTTRGRLLEPYDHFVVWTEGMQKELLEMYPDVRADQITVTGTPQFDFHFDPAYALDRDELCARYGLDPKRPFVVYTAGASHLFPEEHRMIELVIEILSRRRAVHGVQLLVRDSPLGNRKHMAELAARRDPDVIFTSGLKDLDFVPSPDDAAMYTSLLRHAALGINGASTVSLELMLHDKPVINLGFDPPGARLPRPLRYERHLILDHFRPVVTSGGVMVARAREDLEGMITHGLEHPDCLSENRRLFLTEMFGDKLDQFAGRRVAEAIVARLRSELGAAA